MKKSEFVVIYQELVDRITSENKSHLQEQFEQINQTEDSPVEATAQIIATAIASSIQASAQLIFDTIVNLDLLEDDE